jgi:hypothetical protein
MDVAGDFSGTRTSPDGSIRVDAIEDSLNKLQETADKLGRKPHVVLYGRAEAWTLLHVRNGEIAFRSASTVFLPGPLAFSFELILMKPPSSGGCKPSASKARASRPRPMMNGAVSSASMTPAR